MKVCFEIDFIFNENVMSDILSFADELLQSFAEVENHNQIQEQDIISLQNSNERKVNFLSTKCLLDDCLSPWSMKQYDEIEQPTLARKKNRSKYEKFVADNKEKNVALEEVVSTQKVCLQGSTWLLCNMHALLRWL